MAECPPRRPSYPHKLLIYTLHYTQTYVTISLGDFFMRKSISVGDLLNISNIGSFVSGNDIIKATRIPRDDIKLEDKEIYQDCTNYTFSVESQSYYDEYYEVFIKISHDHKILDINCDCMQFQSFETCKHVGAVILYNYEELFNMKEDNKTISNRIIDKFINKEEITIKKELTVNLNIVLNSNYYYRYLEPKITIGLDKLYNLNSKISTFKKVYVDNIGEEVYFGKNFTYNINKYYFNEHDKKIIDAFLELTKGVNGRFYTSSELKKFFKSIKDCSFILENYQINGIIDNFPIKSNLSKKSDVYNLKFDLDNINQVLGDFEYILYQGKLYHLKKDEQELLEELIEYGIDSLEISKDKIEDFTKGLMNVLKKEMVVDGSVDDLVITNNIKSELYFDIRGYYIECSVKFIYDNNIIDYFAKNTIVLRDMEIENKVINDILKYNFVIENNRVLLRDLDKQVEFIEHGLEELAQNYVVYTTEKFKSVNIKKKTNVSSMFSIGVDNIMSFSFDLGDISSDELVNIFKSIKNKNKYYRLKNGDILNLEDEALNELESLSDDLELSDEDIINGRGSILKYRAIYLDSLKNTKYNIINTNNLFDNLIDRFYQFKDSELSLTDLSVLRDYQITGVKWLKTIDKIGFGGILADEMGLGKTIQVIYYIKEMLQENNNYQFLIVVPTSLAYNWDHELEEFAKEINWVICLGNKDKRIKILENNNANVIITTYGTLREDEDLYKDLHFHAILIDEAQNIKNNMAGITKVVKSINADVKFALTGTPLENSILELWSIFDFIMPGYLASLAKFQAKYKIKDFDEDSQKLLTGLSKVINPFILRRKKKDVIKELPDKLINDIYIDMSDSEKKIYAAELERVQREMEEIMATEGMSKARFLILQLLTKLRQICIDPSLVYDGFNETPHKIETLLNIINEYTANNHKILIFSSFKKAIDKLGEYLAKDKIKYYRIDGSIPSKERIKMVDDFNNNDNIKIFLITLKAGGTGLNLTGADVVIHLDLWWNPQVENQATDRAHRIGQTNNVEVIHLINKGTIEEKILELQNKKRKLSDTLIDGEIRDKNILSELSEEDIRNLLSYENKE